MLPDSCRIETLMMWIVVDAETGRFLAKERAMKIQYGSPLFTARGARPPSSSTAWIGAAAAAAASRGFACGFQHYLPLVDSVDLLL